MVAAVVMWTVGLQQRININHFYWDRWHTRCHLILEPLHSGTSPLSASFVVSFPEFPRLPSSWHFLQKALAVLLISLLDINLICPFHLHLRLFRGIKIQSARVVTLLHVLTLHGKENDAHTQKKAGTQMQNSLVKHDCLYHVCTCCHLHVFPCLTNHSKPTNYILVY